MSSVTNVNQTRNQLTTNYDVSKFELGFNAWIDGQVAASGADVDLLQGMVMGRVTIGGKLVPLDSTAITGEELPVGIARIDQTILDGDTDDVRIVNKGRVAESKINFDTADTLDTALGDGRSVRDWLNDLGFELMLGTDLTNLDNQ